MKFSISNLQGVQVLSESDQKAIGGGFCVNTFGPANCQYVMSIHTGNCVWACFE